MSLVEFCHVCRPIQHQLGYSFMQDIIKVNLHICNAHYTSNTAHDVQIAGMQDPFCTPSKRVPYCRPRRDSRLGEPVAYRKGIGRN